MRCTNCKNEMEVEVNNMIYKDYRCRKCDLLLRLVEDPFTYHALRMMVAETEEEERELREMGARVVETVKNARKWFRRGF